MDAGKIALPFVARAMQLSAGPAVLHLQGHEDPAQNRVAAVLDSEDWTKFATRTRAWQALCLCCQSAADRMLCA